MNILTGNVVIKRVWQLLEKVLNPSDLANYSVPIDNQNDPDTKRIPLDKLRVALLNSGLFDYRGDYDASVNLYPASGGSGTGGAILKANAWIVSVGGTIDGNAVIPGQILMAKVDNPGQTSANWFVSLAGGGSGMSVDGTNSNIDYLTFKETPAAAANPRQLFWDEDNQTFSFNHPDGGVIQINQEDFDIYTNLYGGNIVNGDIVAVIGATGNRTAVTLADATNPTTANATIGMCTVPVIADNNPGRITKTGKVRGLNTNAYTEGVRLYVDPSNPGKWTATKPSYPNVIISFGVVSVKHATEGVIDVDVRIEFGDMYLNAIQSITELKTFDSTKAAIKGSSTGKTALASANASANDYTATFPAKSIIVAGLDDVSTLNYFDATIGIGGQYADIAAAQSAGKYRLKAVGNITVSADTTISNAIILDLNGYTMACSTYNFTINSGKKLKIYGNGVITYAYLSRKVLFIVSGSNNIDLEVEYTTITNTSSANNCTISNYGKFSDCTINPANYYNGAFGENDNNWNGILRNVNIVGSGSGCRAVIWNNSTTANDVGENIILSGTFTTNAVIAQSLNGKYSSIFYTGANNVYLTISRLEGLSDANNRVYIDHYASVKNALIQNSRFGFVLTFRANSKFSNCYIHNNATLLNNTVNTDSNLLYDLCEFNGSLTVTGHKNKLAACNIAGISSISSDYNIFFQCTFTGALTINSGAEYNIFIGCIFIGGLTDNSGNTTNIIKDNI